VTVKKNGRNEIGGIVSIGPSVNQIAEERVGGSTGGRRSLSKKGDPPRYIRTMKLESRWGGRTDKGSLKEIRAGGIKGKPGGEKAKLIRVVHEKDHWRDQYDRNKAVWERPGGGYFNDEQVKQRVSGLDPKRGIP